MSSGLLLGPKVMYLVLSASMVRLFWFSQVMTVWNQDAQRVVAASYVDLVARMLPSST